MLPKHEEKAYIQIREEEIRKKWGNYQEGESLQQTFTPLSLTYEMLQKLPSLEGKDVLVVANIETILFLSTLKRDGHVNFNKLHFLTDIKKLEGKEGVSYISFDELDKVDLGMKFDVVIANPPYNEDISGNTKRKGEHHLPSKQLHRVFFDRAFEWISTTGKIVFVMPTNKWWYVNSKSKKNLAERYLKQGLCEVVNKGNPFEGTAVISNIGLFVVDRERNTSSIEDDFHITQPKDNITRFKVKTGRKAADFKKELVECSTGATVRLTLTKSITKASNPEIVEDGSANKWRTCVPLNGTSLHTMGTALTIPPGEFLSASVVAFEMKDEESANRFTEYLNSEEVFNLVKDLRTSAVNSKLNLGFIPTPQWLQ